MVCVLISSFCLDLLVVLVYVGCACNIWRWALVLDFGVFGFWVFGILGGSMQV